MNTKTEKPKLLAQKPKTDLKNNQNRKTENPMPPSGPLQFKIKNFHRINFVLLVQLLPNLLILYFSFSHFFFHIDVKLNELFPKKKTRICLHQDGADFPN